MDKTGQTHILIIFEIHLQTQIDTKNKFVTKIKQKIGHKR